LRIIHRTAIYNANASDFNIRCYTLPLANKQNKTTTQLRKATSYSIL